MNKLKVYPALIQTHMCNKWLNLKGKDNKVLANTNM